MKVLILGGGGTLGAFSAGALVTLDDLGFTPDAVIGSSAGAINLLRWTVGGPREAVDFWCETARVGTIVRGLVHGRNLSEGILDPQRFYDRVEAGVDFERLARDRRNFAFMVADMETGRVALRGNRTEPSVEDLRAVTRGAYALPPLLPPVPLGGTHLADGGLLHNAPLHAAVKLGATSIVYVCNVHTVPRSGFAKSSTLRSAYRYAEIFMRRASNVGFVDAEVVDGRFRGIPFLVIAPPATLAFESVLRWMIPKRDAVRGLVECGRTSAAQAYRPWLRASAEVPLETLS